MVHLLYFGRISDVTGCADEHHALPPNVVSVSALRNWLESRFSGDGVFTDQTVRIAIDNQIVTDDTRLSTPHEIALLPPVGGG